MSKKSKKVAATAKSAAPAASTATAEKSGSESASSVASASLKNFRHQPEMENFYRFIYENDLRFEGLAILDEMMMDKKNRKKVRAARSKLQ